MKYIDEFRNAKAAKVLVAQIKDLALDLPSASIMEICGSHTMAIARSGIKSILPDNIKLLSGPGCPVCVTDAGYIDTAIELAGQGAIIATFGDLLRVPGSAHSLDHARGQGSDIRVCYSPLAALEIAQQNPDKEVVFLGIGFETTIAPVTTIVDLAIRQKIENISLLTAFKQVPPILDSLVKDPEVAIDAFICPPHVSVVIGSAYFEEFACTHKKPAVIASFEPVEILLAIKQVLELLKSEQYTAQNTYGRVVKKTGNTKAQKLIKQYLENEDAHWRGFGMVPGSGLCLKKEFSHYDATHRFQQPMLIGNDNKGCQCGGVLKGQIDPADCPLFGKACNPLHPVGPCMVSSEGSCAACFKYRMV